MSHTTEDFDDDGVSIRSIDVDEIMGKSKKKGKRPHVKISATTKAPNPTATLVKQFSEIDKRTRCEETTKEEKKLRIYTAEEGKKTPIDVVKGMAKKKMEGKAGLDAVIALSQIVEQLVGVIEKLPESVMSFDDKAKVMQFKDIRIHKPMSEKMKKGIKKKEEKEKKNEFLSALDDLE